MNYDTKLTFYLLDGYTTPEFIAEGTFGAVWKSTRPSPDSSDVTDDPTAAGRQDVAIKVIRDIGSVNRVFSNECVAYLRRVFREVQVMKLFSDCEEFIHILDMYLSADGRDLFIVMPFVDHSLTSVMSDPQVNGIGLQEDLTRYIVLQLLVALSRMERCACIHRDLSMSNVLVDTNCYSVFLADFGMSRAHYEPGYDMTNVEIVTLPYRPPEIALRGQRLSNKIDIWSLGIIAVECLIGRPFLCGAKDDLGHLALIVQNVDRPTVLDERTKSMMSPAAFQWLQQSWRYIEENATPDLANVFVARGKTISKECLDVLTGMLRFHPDDRMSAAELLKMPWFAMNPDDAAEIERLLKNPQPLQGLSPAHETEEFDAMLRYFQESCAERIPTQRMELAYSGRHVDR